MTPEQIAKRVARAYHDACREAVSAIIDDAAAYAADDEGNGCTIALFRSEYAFALRRHIADTILVGASGHVEVTPCVSAPGRCYVEVTGASPTTLRRCQLFADGMRAAMDVIPLPAK